MYFRNKFNEEFLELCNLIEPKGISRKISTHSSPFFEYKINPQTGRVMCIPLVLYNKLISSNINDTNLEDFVMLCEDTPDTIITAVYDEDYVRESEQFVCSIAPSHGDFVEEDTEL
ncbi:hypothetical protein [Methanosphaera sp.]